MPESSRKGTNCRLGARENLLSAHFARPLNKGFQRETLLGQGTVGLEFEEQAPPLDSLLVATGRGGLIGGIASWYGSRIKIVGVAPATAPTLTRALEAGGPVDPEAGGIAADSPAPKRVGKLMFPIAQAHVRDLVLVSDESIQEAQLALWKVLRVVAEPGGAAALAAVAPLRASGRRTNRCFDMWSQHYGDGFQDLAV